MEQSLVPWSTKDKFPFEYFFARHNVRAVWYVRCDIFGFQYWSVWDCFAPRFLAKQFQLHAFSSRKIGGVVRAPKKVLHKLYFFMEPQWILWSSSKRTRNFPEWSVLGLCRSIRSVLGFCRSPTTIRENRECLENLGKMPESLMEVCIFILVKFSHYIMNLSCVFTIIVYLISW